MYLYVLTLWRSHWYIKHCTRVTYILMSLDICSKFGMAKLKVKVSAGERFQKKNEWPCWLWKSAPILLLGYHDVFEIPDNRAEKKVEWLKWMEGSRGRRPTQGSFMNVNPFAWRNYKRNPGPLSGKFKYYKTLGNVRLPCTDLVRPRCHTVNSLMAITFFFLSFLSPIRSLYLECTDSVLPIILLYWGCGNTRQSVKMRRVKWRELYKTVLPWTTPSHTDSHFPEQGYGPGIWLGLFQVATLRFCVSSREEVAQTRPLIPGAGSQSGRTVSMETGTLEMFSRITPWGSATNRNISRKRPKYSCIHGDSSSQALGWNVALEQMPWAWPGDVFNILQCLHLPSEEASHEDVDIGAARLCPPGWVTIRILPGDGRAQPRDAFLMRKSPHCRAVL